jgi:hypothetical protein
MKVEQPLKWGQSSGQVMFYENYNGFNPGSTGILAVCNPCSGAHSVENRTQIVGSVPPTIISFTSDLDSVTLDDAETGNAVVTFAWQTVGVMDDLQVQLHVYQINGWINSLSRDVDPLPATGTYRTQIQHSQTFSPPMYRLVIVSPEKDDGEWNILDERVIVIPYDVPDSPSTPIIDSFTTSASSVDADALASGQARIPVSWQVNNRLPTVNPVFEQVFDDLTATNVELPRPNLWATNESVRDRLGWATSNEVPYQAAWQNVTRSEQANNREPRDRYISLPDNRIVFLESQESSNWWGVWQYVN